ncbi:hypothetical protein EDD85DRAFT_113373 [Armillaria nabsnona]|nr:hypothetical protein EDD85DRAFT_113373 [Armillaria nabsnona]
MSYHYPVSKLVVASRCNYSSLRSEHEAFSKKRLIPGEETYHNMHSSLGICPIQSAPAERGMEGYNVAPAHPAGFLWIDVPMASLKKRRSKFFKASHGYSRLRLSATLGTIWKGDLGEAEIVLVRFCARSVSSNDGRDNMLPLESLSSEVTNTFQATPSIRSVLTDGSEKLTALFQSNWALASPPFPIFLLQRFAVFRGSKS